MKKLVLLFCVLMVCVFGSCRLNSAKSKTYSMSGLVQKGPFQVGSKVTVQEVDESLDPTGLMYTTTTKDDFGSFALSNKFSSKYVEVDCEGFYFNECANGTGDAKLILRSYGDLSVNKPLNLNILTTIAHDRIKKLVGEGKSLAQARDQAESELLVFLGIDAISGLHFYDFNLESGGSDAALLLAVSAALQNGQSVAQLSLNIADLANDFADDGVITDDALITKLRDGANRLNVQTITNNLKKHYEDRGKQVIIPDFTSYINKLKTVGGILGKPVFSLASGTYIEPQTVTITAPSGSEIYYTTDGSAPTAQSSRYTAPITIQINSDITLKAIAILNGVQSQPTVARYIVKDGRYGADYTNTTPGHFVEYVVNGYNNFDNSTPVSCKLYSIVEEGSTSNPYNTCICTDLSRGYCDGYMTAPSNGSIFAIIGSGASIAGSPYFAWYMCRLVALPKLVIFGEQFSSTTGVVYYPLKLANWKTFSDLIEVDFDSSNFSFSNSGDFADLNKQLRGTGKLLFAKNIGLVYFELKHTSASNPPNKTETMEYSGDGLASKIEFYGTCNINGVPAEGYTIAPVAWDDVSSYLSQDSYSSVSGTDGGFSLFQYAIPGSFFRLDLMAPDFSYVDFKFKVPSGVTRVNLGEIGGVQGHSYIDIPNQ